MIGFLVFGTLGAVLVAEMYYLFQKEEKIDIDEQENECACKCKCCHCHKEENDEE
jgi:hypothetical protein